MHEPGDELRDGPANAPAGESPDDARLAGRIEASWTFRLMSALLACGEAGGRPVVRLPMIDRHRFPPRCAGCGVPSPRWSWVVFARAHDGLAALLPVPLPLPARFGGARRVVVPYCGRCLTRHVARQVALPLVGVSVTLGVILGVIWITRTYLSPGWMYPLGFLALLFVLMPCYAVLLIREPPVTAWRERGEIVHEFASPWAAVRFARANGGRARRSPARGAGGAGGDG